MAPDATPSHGALSLADTVLVSNRGPLAFHEENGRPVPGRSAGGWPARSTHWWWAPVPPGWPVP